MLKPLLVLLAVSMLPAAALAAPKTYQVTGPVLEVREDAIVVQKGSDKWEVNLDATVKAPVGLKAGDKVTIEYVMTAKSVEVKGAAPEKAVKTKAKKK